jgi:hypothetical protein
VNSEKGLPRSAAVCRGLPRTFCHFLKGAFFFLAGEKDEEETREQKEGTWTD